MMEKLAQLLKKMDLEKSHKLFSLESERWKERIPYRIQRGLEKISPDKFYVQSHKPLILFFDLTENNVNKEDIFKQVWNLNESPVIFLINSKAVEIYNGNLLDQDRSVLKKLKIDGREAKPSDFSFWNLLSGKVWDKMKQETAIRNGVDYNLLENIKGAQKEFVKSVLEKNTSLNKRPENKEEIRTIANNLIGRLLFSRYLLDRGIKRYFNSNSDFLRLILDKDRLYMYFSQLYDNFNGDLFPVTSLEKKVTGREELELLNRLFSGDKFLADGVTQQSLFDLYDFEIIPIELISEVYERFVGNQKIKGAYYTPSFLADYILDKTIKKHLKDNYSCRVMDPACGSGIFLVETLRCLIEKNQTRKELSQEDLHRIIKDNIFGVDNDQNAINIANFSICLTLLDYQSQEDIPQFKLPTLINHNLFVANFFDLEHEFNKKINNLDFILTNPPWRRTSSDSHHVSYAEREKIPIKGTGGGFQIAESFTMRVKDFSARNTECALILTSKILYNHSSNKIRKYLLENFAIKEVLELSSVRRHLFERSIAPTTVIFYKYAYEKDTKDNIIIHTSIKPNIFLKLLKIIVIESNDIKKIKQQYFVKYDWLWKVMLYGNVLDFYFMKRLKENYKEISDIAEDYRLTFGAGFGGAGSGKIRENLKDMVYIEPEEIESYKQDYEFKEMSRRYSTCKFDDSGVLDSYKAPHLLIKKSLSSDGELIVTYLEKECAFPNRIFGLHGESSQLLKSIGSLLSSSLVKYLLFLGSSDFGVERPEIIQKELKILPIKLNNSIIEVLADLFDDLLDITNKRDAFSNSFKYETYRDVISDIISRINDIIFDRFDIDVLERNLVNYMEEISIPLFFNRSEAYKEVGKGDLKKYAQVFFDHFSSRWGETGTSKGFFEIEIYYNKYIVGMNFKIVDERPEKAIHFPYQNYELKQLNKIKDLFKIASLGVEKIANKFYVQRDVRGFGENSFYIIKPNEYKNWHPAVAQADLREFIDAIMNAGRNHIDGE